MREGKTVLFRFESCLRNYRRFSEEPEMVFVAASGETQYISRTRLTFFHTLSRLLVSIPARGVERLSNKVEIIRQVLFISDES